MAPPTWDAAAILALIGITLDTFVYTPCIVYWTYHIWEYRNTLIIRKRYYSILFRICIVAMLYYMIQRNSGFLIYSGLLPEVHLNWLYALNCYFFPMFNYGLYYIVVYRYWLLYFASQLAMAQSDGEWRGIIDPNDVERNWWILNHSRFGSVDFLFKYLCLLLAAIVAVEGSLWLWHSLTSSVAVLVVVVSLDAIIMIIPLLLTVYIRQTLPQLRDRLRIKEELKHIFLIVLLAFIVVAVLSMIVGTAAAMAVESVDDQIDDDDDEEEQDLEAMGRTIWLAVSNVSTLGTFLCVYVQTQWVLHKFRAFLHHYSSRKVLQNSLTLDILENKKEMTSDKEAISITDVLSHEKAFELFMTHLIKEHSSECLLSLVEMMEFKECVLDAIKSLQMQTQQQNTMNHTNGNTNDNDKTNGDHNGNDDDHHHRNKSLQTPSTATVTTMTATTTTITAIDTVAVNTPSEAQFAFNTKSGGNNDVNDTVTESAGATMTTDVDGVGDREQIEFTKSNKMRVNSTSQSDEDREVVPEPDPDAEGDGVDINLKEDQSQIAMTVTVDHDDNDNNDGDDGNEGHDGNDGDSILEVPRFNKDGNGDCIDTEVITLDLNCGISAESKASRRSGSMTTLQRVLSPSVKSMKSMTSMSIRLPTATQSLRSQRRVRSGSLSTVNGLIVFPKSLPKSAICHQKELYFLSDIPGVELSPKQKLNADLDEAVMTQCINIRHRVSSSTTTRTSTMTRTSSPSRGRMQAVWSLKGSEEEGNGLKLKTVEQSRSALSSINSMSSVMVKSKSLKANRSLNANVIRSEEDLVEEWKVRGYMMWYKYAAEGAEFEINIDYGTRHSLGCSMRDINEWLSNDAVTLPQLSVLFDVCMHQMYQFCKASMVRFKRSDDFDALLRCFTIEPHQEEFPELQLTAVSP